MKANLGTGRNWLFGRVNLTRETVTAMHEAMDWPGCLFEEKWRAGKELREGHVEELRLLRELVTMDSPLIRKHSRLLVAGNDAGQQDGYFPAVLAATGVDRHEGAKPGSCPGTPKGRVCRRPWMGLPVGGAGATLRPPASPGGRQPPLP